MHGLGTEVTQALSNVLASKESDLPVLQRFGFKNPGRFPYSFNFSKGAKQRPSATENSAQLLSPATHEHTNSNEATSQQSIEHEQPPDPSSSSQISQGSGSAPNKVMTQNSNVEGDLVLADQLASFVSRIKYLYDDMEATELAPLSLPGNAAYADQRSLIKSQAARIRNQLDLKFSSISLINQLDKFSGQSNGNGGNSDGASRHTRYNPLQIIRDRSKRPPVGTKPTNTPVNIWQIPVSEQIQDTRWRYRTARLRAHKQRKRHRKSASSSARGGINSTNSTRRSSVATNTQDNTTSGETGDNFECPEESEHPVYPVTPPRSTHNYTEYHEQPLPWYSAKFTGSGKDTRLAECPTQHLPKAECTELIDLLRSSHTKSNADLNSSSSESVYGDQIKWREVGRSVSNDSSQFASRRSPSPFDWTSVHTIDDMADANNDSLLPLPPHLLASQGKSANHELNAAQETDSSAATTDNIRMPPTTPNNSAAAANTASTPSNTQPTSEEANNIMRTRFCRNTASVTDTWNRLYRSPGPSRNGSRPSLGYASDDGNLKLLSRTLTGQSSQSGASAYDSGAVVSDGDELGPLPMPYRPSAARTSSATSNNEHPLLTVTTDRGDEKKLIDDSITNANTVLARHRGSTGSRSAMSQNSTVESTLTASEWPNKELRSTSQDFGRLREGFSTTDLRRDPTELALMNAETDLRFLIPYYTIVLRREDPQIVFDRLQKKYASLSQHRHLQLSDTVKNQTVTKFIQYLSKIEHDVVSEQQVLDADIASSLDALRISTDLLVSDVNTTLNRRTREISSRIERLAACRSGGFGMSVVYTSIEYGVLCVLWLIWTAVQVFKPLKVLLLVLRFICSNLIIA